MSYIRPLLLALPLNVLLVASCDEGGETDFIGAGGSAGSSGSGGSSSGGSSSGGSKASGGSTNAGGANGAAGGDGLGGGDSAGGAPGAGGANGGAGAPSDGGAGGASDGACPVDAPQDNDACTAPGALCQWGATRCLCRTNNNQWQCEATDCPDMRPDNAVSCQGVDTRICRYGRAICLCNGQDEWACRQCPIQQPQQDANCPTIDVSCPYVDATCTCTADGWDCN